MSKLLEAVRKAALPAIWSQGVKLAREGAVSLVGQAPGEATLRVKAAGHAIAPTVVLCTDDPEWSCDCGGKVDPCAHAAAAAIAFDQGTAQGSATEEGAAPTTQAPSARLVYRLGTRSKLLTLTRVIVHADGREEPLRLALSSGLSLNKLPPGLSPTHDDLAVERALGSPPRDVVALTRVSDVLNALSSAEVTLDGVKVRASGERLLPRVVVTDGGGGSFTLKIEANPSLSSVIAMGVARCGNVLRPLGETTISGDLLERLPLSRSFPKAQVSELVTRILPELEEKLPVVIQTKRLPRQSKDARPRIAMDLSHQGHTLSVLPTLVYGDPAIARIDNDTLVSLGKQVPLRRRDEERELLRKLRDELNLVPGRRVDLDGAEAIRFAGRLREFQRNAGDEAHAAVFEDRPLLPRLAFDSGVFDILFEYGDEGETEGEAGARRNADAASVMRAWRDGLDLVPLEGGGWAPLPSDWLSRHGHLVADLLAARDPEKKLPAAALPALGVLCDDLGVPKPFELTRLAPLLEGFEGIPQAPLPDDLQASLRGYQQHGVDWLTFLRETNLGGVLADDMGLGKTLQTICVLRGRCLVVCPKSVVYNWADEIARFRPSLQTSIYGGTRRELDPNADVTLVTYAVLRLDAEKLAKQAWDMVVLDEAQAIKNDASQTARAAFRLQGGFRIALSGTPVENRLEELWSVMRFANPGLLGDRSDFQERYSSPIASGNAGAAGRLRAKIRPFVLRRMKREVLPELPPRTDAVLHVELDDAERSVYDAVRVATKKDVAEKLAQGGSVLAALEALLRLRQAACHAGLVPGQHAASSSKIERLVEALSEAASDGHKALVFSQWTGLLDRVEPHLTSAGISFTRLDGSTRDRGAVVATFQDEAGPPVMLVSLKAGGTGLNLTAADHVFLLDPWWNPAVEDQAADRAHRIGQDRPVMVYRMVAHDTVEERILALQEKKRVLADVALGNADHAGGITREELLALLD